MHPAFDLGFTQLPAYFTLLMFGFTLAILLAHREAPKRGIDGNFMLDLGLLMLACGLIGARILHVIADGQFWDYVHLCTDPSKVPALALGNGIRCASDAQCLGAGLGDVCESATGLCRQSQDCLRVFKIWYGGYAYYGGFLLAVPTGIWYLRRHRQPMWPMADIAGWGIAFGLIFGRLGCFLAGCCFGNVTDSATGIAFPRHSPAWDKHLSLHSITEQASHSLPVHPTQLYEAVACLLIFLVCLWRYRRGARFPGEVFFLFMLQYAVFRFLVEFLRADDRGEWFGLLSTSQWISVPLLLWSGWVLARGRSWPLEPRLAPRTQPATAVAPTENPGGDHGT